MYQSGKNIGFWGAVSLGIGAMVGAGIFALLGEAGSIAGSAVYISFIVGGVIALLSGYSLGKLGAQYPSAGGIVEYLVQSYGVGIFSGAMSIMLYIAAVVSISLIAKAFGNYAASLMPLSWKPWSVNLLACGVVLLFVGINLRGAKDVARIELLTVVIKFSVLAMMAIVGIYYLNPALMSPTHFKAPSSIFYSLAITFFAYEGFRVITNTAEDMDNPEKQLPRAMMTAIFLVMLLYIGIALAVFGNMPADKVVAAKDYALAEAAKPIFGQTGFILVAITALISTASAINANLYAVTNVTYELARKGELPARFGKPIAHSREGLLISAFIIILISLFFDLGSIAILGSVSILFVHTIVHFGHLRMVKRTGANWNIILLAGLSSLSAALLAVVLILDKSQDIHHFLSLEIWVL